MTITAKFMLGSGLIVVFIIAILSFLGYEYLKKIYIDDAFQRTDLVLGHIDATMAYAREELRPQVFHALPENVFIRQVMSSSFMNMGIMKRFKQRFPHYIYKRVAIDPMNPADKADAFEEGYIRKFQNAPASMRQWRGLVSINGEDYFLHLKAVVAEQECLLCHGDPAASPESINRHYGTVHARHWKVGDVIGLESIAAPVSGTLNLLRHAAFVFFITLCGVMGIFFAVFNYFHYRVAVLPMKRMISFFKDVVSGHRGLDIHFDESNYYEMTELAGSFNRMMGYLKESAEEKDEMEQRVQRANRLASIGQLAAGVAHEINNPLSLILGYVKILRKECRGDGQTKEDLETIYNNAMLCKKIVDDLLNFSRQEKTNLIHMDLNACIESVITSSEDAFKRGGVSITRNYDDALPVLPADEDKLKRSLANLLINSFQAMKPGGRITITTEYDREGNGARIIFSDTGSGIPEKLLGKIFDPFFTTKPPGQGTGLGLAVTYGIVKEHKGTITVKSEEGVGTSFTLWFPLGGNKE